MGLFYRRYLDSEKIRGFDNYKYACVDTSPLAVYISHPFWNWFVQFYPTWLAPNVLTLAGFSCVLGCYLLVSYLDPILDANSVTSPSNLWLPAWVWPVCAVCTFLGHLLDGTDGKQARRTGASGPTGELFDHGLDSWATVPFTITIFSIFGRGEFSVSPVRLLGILISVQLVFIATHWEKYNTGVLYLSWGYDASQYGLVLFYILTYYVGHQWFQFYVFGSMTFAKVFEIGFYAVCILSLFMSVYNICHCYFISKAGKQVHLIINQMTCTRVELFNGLLFLYILVAISAVKGFFTNNELLVLQYLAAFLTAAHMHYGICVVQQLCAHFKIQAFSLDYLKQRRRE